MIVFSMTASPLASAKILNRPIHLQHQLYGDHQISKNSSSNAIQCNAYFSDLYRESHSDTDLEADLSKGDSATSNVSPYEKSKESFFDEFYKFLAVYQLVHMYSSVKMSDHPDLGQKFSALFKPYSANPSLGIGDVTQVPDYLSPLQIVSVIENLSGPVYENLVPLDISNILTLLSSLEVATLKTDGTSKSDVLDLYNLLGKLINHPWLSMESNSAASSTVTPKSKAQIDSATADDEINYNCVFQKLPALKNYHRRCPQETQVLVYRFGSDQTFLNRKLQQTANTLIESQNQVSCKQTLVKILENNPKSAFNEVNQRWVRKILDQYHILVDLDDSVLPQKVNYMRSVDQCLTLLPAHFLDGLGGIFNLRWDNLTKNGVAAYYSPSTLTITLNRNDDATQSNRAAVCTNLFHELTHRWKMTGPLSADASKISKLQSLQKSIPFLIQYGDPTQFSEKVFLLGRNNFVSDYAATDPDEDLAETVAQMIYSPFSVKSQVPELFDFLYPLVFGGDFDPMKTQLQYLAEIQNRNPTHLDEFLFIKDMKLPFLAKLLKIESIPEKYKKAFLIQWLFPDGDQSQPGLDHRQLEIKKTLDPALVNYIIHLIKN